MSKQEYNFKDANNLNDLAKFIGCSSEFIEDIETNGRSFLERCSIPKKDIKKGYRTIYKINSSEYSSALKTFSKRFGDFLIDHFLGFPSESAHGFLSGKSILTNAENHVNSTHLLKADILNFFKSISKDKIKEKFCELGLNKTIVEPLTEFVCPLDHLPLGLPSSPVISNLVINDIDKKILKLAKEKNVRYSRYVDDLTFSGNSEIDINFFDLNKILKTEGFQLNKNKFFRKKRGQSFYVTGLSVSEKDVPHIPRAMKRKLRQEVYYIKKYGLENHFKKYKEQFYLHLSHYINYLKGSLRYARYMDYQSTSNYLDTYKNLPHRFKSQSSFNLNGRFHNLYRDEYSIYIDESTIEVGDKEMLMLGCCLVPSEDADKAKTGLHQLVQDLIADPYTTGDKEKIKKNNLHWTELSEGTRTKVFDLIATHHLSHYVEYDLLIDKAKETYENLYKKMLSSRLKDLFSKLDGCPCLKIFIENNPKIKSETIKNNIQKLFDELKKGDLRSPCKLIINANEEKSNLQLTLIDTPLGILGQYLKLDFQTGYNDDNLNRSTHFKRFETLRHTFRVIYCGLYNKKHTRRHPIKFFSKESLLKKIGNN